MCGAAYKRRALTISLSNNVQGALPAGLVEEVDQDVAHEADAVADAGLVDLVGGGLEGPVDEQGAADDVLAGDEAPVAAVEATRCGCRPWRRPCREGRRGRRPGCGWADRRPRWR